MLVLHRRHGESILIGEDITVTLVFKNHTSYLHIDAPKEVPIVRTELVRKYPKNFPHEKAKISVPSTTLAPALSLQALKEKFYSNVKVKK
jgi:carbon storage regulator CsrA